MWHEKKSTHIFQIHCEGKLIIQDLWGEKLKKLTRDEKVFIFFKKS